MIRGFVAEGRTVLLSSHLLDEVERICDQVAIVDRGRVVSQGAIGDLTGEPALLIATSDDEEALLIVSCHRAVQRLDLDAGGLRLRLLPDVDVDAATDDIGRRLVEGGVAIRRFERTRPSLEERFLEVTS
jgi:ABC-2 type transport system ATP-binding protein